MKLVDAHFVTSAVDARGVPRDGLPHVAMVGRSNVGKSTLINALARQKLARTSAAPGKTRLANLYRLTVDGGAGGPGRWSVYLADLPGYGYARGGDTSVVELAKVAEEYFAAAGLRPSAPGSRDEPADRVRPGDGGHLCEIAGVFHLVDARHPGLDADLEAYKWLSTIGVGRTTLATKIDKLTRNERVRNLNDLERIFGMPAVPVSAVSGEGLDDLWTLIARLTRTR